MVQKKANSLEISDIRVKYDKNDGSLRLTSKDPDLKGKPFSITLTTASPTAQMLIELMKAEGLIPDDTIPKNLVLQDLAQVASLYSPAQPLTFVLGQTFSESLVEVDFSVSPHCSISGSTGSGKTVLLRSIAQQAMLRPNINLTILDFSSVEWQASELRSNDKVVNTIEAAQTELMRLSNEIELRYTRLKVEGKNRASELKDPVYEFLLIDQAWLFLAERAEEDDELAKANRALAREQISNLLRVGRVVGIHVILASQYFDYTMLSGEAQANLAIRIAMGQTSYSKALEVFGKKAAYSFNMTQPRGRGVVQVYDKQQQPFQAYYSAPDLTK